MKISLLEECGEFICLLLGEGNIDEGFDSGFDLFGNVGFVLVVCCRYEIDEYYLMLKNVLVFVM